MQQVQVLAFVFVQAFDLHVEQRIRADDNAGASFDERRQFHFVLVFDVAVFFAEFRVVGIFFQPFEHIEIVGPLFLQFLIKQSSQCRVALFNPAARRDAVGDVMEFVRPQLVIFREQIFHH
ncbi:hypothetical protein D3C75_936740 [compost metagenome]